MAVEVIVVALLASLIGPLVLSYFQHKARVAEKREDWRRQDEVAARLLVENSKTNGKLDAIHSLVNSDMTEALHAQLVALRGQAQLLSRAIVRAEYDDEASATAALEAVHMQIARLRQLIEDREKGDGR